MRRGPLKVSDETRDNLEDNPPAVLHRLFAAAPRPILKEQDTKSKSDDKGMIENLHFVKDLGLQNYKTALEMLETCMSSRA